MDEFDLSGRVAIITGGNGGIGRGIALALARAGADVAVAARNDSKTEGVVSELREIGRESIGITCDVTRKADIDDAVARTIAELGPPTIIVNNSGVGRAARPEDVTEEDWGVVLDTNLKAPLLLAQAVHGSMLEAGQGKVINIGSEASLFGGKILASYSASKGGLLQLTKSMAAAWASDNIQVNCIIPGWIRTDITSLAQTNPERSGLIVGRTPAGRWGEPSDLGGTAVFLASAASDFVTGVAIPVDGGYAANLL